MRFITIALTTLFAAGVLAGQSTSGSAKQTTHKTRKKAALKPKPDATTTASAHRPTTAHRAISKSSNKPVSAARRSNQQQPTPERYKEIQQALAERGYFNGAVDGNWGPESVDALKRFQREQNLTEDGKLGSLSIIALGLGPRRAEPVERSTQQ